MFGISPPQSPCFTPGTPIETETGPCAVEALVPGQKVQTRDNGLQPILWTGGRTVPYAEIAACRDLRPVLIRRGAFGPGRPSTDIEVSPEHRFLVRGTWMGRTFLDDEVLVAARHLIDGKRIVWADVLETRYIHVMCEAHQVIRAAGAWTESFQADAQTLARLPRGLRDEIGRLLPDAGASGQVTARRVAGAA